MGAQQPNGREPADAGAGGDAAGETRLGQAASDAVAGKISAADEEQWAPAQCVVCSKTAFHCPVTLTACSHMGHRTCLSDWVKKNNYCPRCKKDIRSEQVAYRDADLTMQELLNKARIRCPQECEPGKLIPYGDLRHHLATCPKTPLACTSPGCAVVALRGEMAAHQAVCLDAEVTCEQCGGTAKRRRLQIESESADLVAAYRDRAAEALGVPSSLTMASAEHPDLSGKYVLLHDKVNGRPVWGRGPRRLYATPSGFWFATDSPDGMKNSKGLLKLGSTDAVAPIASENWSSWNGSEFREAPQTAVTVES
eukprot:TRINITY_DN11322_c0_g1_i1.p1 TRINITY_DN11322_c0_g1~~TRINITY_DN11322_c0_g1_i1.p1  ORF type:complete len:327 (+),score=46.32 TRINITY_DN11322_c0_g1_i1:53-982(+)